MATSIQGLSFRNILVVDDDVTAIRMLRETLHQVAKVRFATNGADALRLAQERAPDVILLDGDMPGENGFEVCTKLKANEALAEIPVIFVSAHSDLAFETRALELGAADFIAKPINPAVVQLRVRLHLHLKEQVDELRRLSGTDALTQLGNRRSFDERFANEWKRAHRNGSVLSLLVIDVDYFKRYNDEYGHKRGDECLQRVGAAIARCGARAQDFPARIGGEEFAVLLPETPAAGALAVAESLRTSVASEAIAHARNDAAPHVTVSIGIACAAPARVQGEAGCGALFEQADAALYAAKRAGRDRVVVARAEPDFERGNSHIRAAAVSRVELRRAQVADERND
jgi:diguanylate cyclase (GGDEF)-like protein